MADGIAGGPATPDMRRQDNNSILGNFLHWMFVGNKPGAGLDAVPGQFLQSINPSSKAGLANLLSMFAGGGKFDASPQMGELGMPGQFGPYSVGKASAGGHLSSDTIPSMLLHAIKTGQGKEVHDVLFGGEVHAKGGIPRRPDTTYTSVPPRNTNEVIQSIAQKNHVQADAATKERAVAEMLHRHGMANHDPKGQPEFVQHIEHVTRTDQMPHLARVYSGHSVNVGKTGLEHGIFNILAGGTKALRQAELRKLLQQQLLNHRN